MLYIRSVNADRACITVIKPGQQTGNRRLAGAGRSNQTYSLARLCLKGKVVKDLIPFVIRKRHMFKTDTAGHRRKRFCVRKIFYFFRQIHHIKNTLGRCQSSLDISGGTGNTLDGVGNIDGISQKGDQRTGGGFAGNHVITAEPEDHGHPQGRYKFDCRSKGCHVSGIFQIGIKVSLILPFEPVYFILFPYKRLDHPGRRNRFLQHRSDIGRSFLDHPAGAADFFPKEIHKIQNDREGQNGKQGQLPVQIDHGADRAHQNDAFRNQLNRIVNHSALERIDVIRHIAHDGAGLVLVIKGHGQPLQFSEHFTADINDHMLSHIAHEVILSIQKDSAEKKDYNDTD